MKRVAVSQRVDVYTERGERRDALDQRITAFIHAAGGVVFPVPNTLLAQESAGDALAGWLHVLAPQAIVLTGGDDLGVHPDRDMTDFALMTFASEHGLPLLGLCRGMQVMGVGAGATLKTAPGHVGVRHAVTGAISGSVNSFHTGVLADCPSGFEVAAVSEDGHIEAIRHRERPWEGWMWHPEREARFNARDVRAVQTLFGEGGL